MCVSGLSLHFSLLLDNSFEFLFNSIKYGIIQFSVSFFFHSLRLLKTGATISLCETHHVLCFCAQHVTLTQSV